MKRLLLVFATCALGCVTGCSGGGTSSVVPPPTTGFSNASLTGAYVFSITGSTDDPIADEVDSFSRIGVFVADGKGDIAATGGLEDDYMYGSNNPFGITGGNYVINSDGRGTLCLLTSGGGVQYSISLSASSSGYIADMGATTACPSSNTTISDTETASGSFQLQSATTLASGTYVFDFSGISPISGNPISILGDFIANGSSFSSGSYEDVNDGGTIVPKAIISGGDYLTDSTNPGTGRGTASIGGRAFVYYVIDSQHVQLMETDGDEVNVGTIAGEAVAQQAGTPNSVTAFNSSSFVFVMGGSDTEGDPFTRGGRLTATGANLSGILLDQNDAGSVLTVPSTGVLSAGTITMDGDNSGRGTITFTDTVSHTGTFSFVFYLSSATQGVIQDVTTVQVGGVATAVDIMDGSFLAQTGNPFSTGSLATSYAFNWSGVDSFGEEDFVGSFTPANANPNGLVDYNEFGADKLFLSNPLNGVFTIGGDGTGSTGQHSAFVAGISGTPSVDINYFAYIANPNTILVMGTGTNRIIAGVLTAQTP